MLDELLGRAPLKARIEDLEDEIHHLERQLEAEKQRRADAVSERQDAQERVNRLQDRIADLEGKLDADSESDASPSASRHAETLRGRRLADVLDRLESFTSGPEGILTAYVEDGHDVPEPVRTALGDRVEALARATPCLVVADDAGLLAATLSVPLAPAPFATWDDHVTIERAWFEPTGEYALALVRGDVFALGVYDGRERTAFEGFTSDVQASHSKGGFSQARFERRRDEQIETHLDRCRDALASCTVDRRVVVGERAMVGEVAAAADATATVDATGDPEPALDDAWRSFWTVRLRGL